MSKGMIIKMSDLTSLKILLGITIVGLGAIIVVTLLPI